MSIDANWGNLFKPELKSSGRKLIAEEKISISSGSDAFIQAYVRAAPPSKVVFSSDGIDSATFFAECNCPAAKKSRFCKHIWATLVLTEEKFPDFLAGKREIEQKSSIIDKSGGDVPSYAEVPKKRSSDYRKEQYQKQKSRLKEQKRDNKRLSTAVSLSSYTPEVEQALAYFSSNGFPMPAGPSEEILGEAKRRLSRVFHPDKGGTHAESVELNQNCEVIVQFLRG